MNTINLDTITNIHFIGIGGVGVSAVARMMHDHNKIISGTNDVVSADTLDGLRAKGVDIVIETESVGHISSDCELFVYSVAWERNFPDFLKKIRNLGKPMLTYHEFLGLVSQHFFTIAIAGAHGKTTTTAMTVDVCASLKPYAIVGSLLSTGSNYAPGDSKYLIVEADDYARGFLNLSPNILVITTIDEEHLDVYKDLADIQNTFNMLANKVPQDGFVICDLKDEKVRPAVEGLSCTVIDVSKDDVNLDLNVIGHFNHQNAQKAYAVGKVFGISDAEMRSALKAFKGTWRRQEYKGKTGKGALIYTDYAHHPTEIAALLQGFKEHFAQHKIVALFQPHSYSRPKTFFTDFVESLAIADEIVVTPIYPAREPHDPSISSDMIVDALVAKGKKALLMVSRDDIKKYVDDHADENTIILVITAGDLYTISGDIVA